jgi:hypothetical protein
MAGKPDRSLITRRRALAGLASAACFPLAGGSRATAEGAGPIFSNGGPNAELYGAGDHYPVPNWWHRLREGNPFAPKYRVGGFSHIDDIFPTRRVARASAPWDFKRAPTEIRYRFRGNASSIEEYLARNPVTGLLIAKDDQILCEHYQYGRTDRDRLVSQSMVKSITGLLVGSPSPKAPSNRSTTRLTCTSRDSGTANMARHRSARCCTCLPASNSASNRTMIAI